MKHHQWRHLVRELGSVDGLQAVRQLTEMEHKLALWAPVTLARWIATEQPELLDRPALRILVVGAETVDAVDDGMWYAALPALLGRPEMNVSVELVGKTYGEVSPELKPFLGETPPRTRFAGKLPNPSRSHKQTISAYLKSNASDGFNLAVMFHPGFDSNFEEWFSDDGLHRLARSVPIFVAALHADEYITDRLVLEAYGFGDIGAPVVNPFTVQTDNEAAWFAHTLWRFPTKVPAEARIHDERAHARMETLNQVLGTSFVHGHPEELCRFGIYRSFEGPNGQENLVALPFDYWLHGSSGQLFLVGAGGGLYPWRGHVVERADIDAYPGADAAVYDRAVWCADVVKKYGIGEETIRAAYHDMQQQMPRSRDPMPSIESLFPEATGLFDDPEKMRASFEMLFQHAKTHGDIPDLSPKEAATMMTNIMVNEPKRKVPEAAIPLFDALHRKDFAAACAFLEAHPQMVDMEDEDGMSPLYIGAVLDQPEFVRFCAKLGANPNHRDREGWPIVTEAVRRRAPRGLDALLQLNDTDINLSSKMGWTALHLALTIGEFESAGQLVDAGADFDLENMAGITARQLLEEIPDVPDALRAKVLRHAVKH